MNSSKMSPAADPSGIERLQAGAVLSPFPRLRELLRDIASGHDRTIELTIGEPRGAMPGFVIEKLTEAQALYGKYPPIHGTGEFRQSIADWIRRRYGTRIEVDPDTEILPLNGSREGLFYAVFPAVARKRSQGVLQPGEAPVVLMPNPFYQTYAGAALAAECEPHYLPATLDTGFLPDLDALAQDDQLLRRTAAFYLCSPSNPEGAIASSEYLGKALQLARQYGFMLFADECYSEIYTGEPPVSALEVAMASGEGLASLLVFNSLSKRSNLPGLRSGFCAGDPVFIAALLEMRNLIGPQMPLPTQHLSTALWSEEQHVSANRQAYREKFDIADAVLGTRYGYQRPAGGFFLWLDMSQFGGSIDATVTLWKGCGVKVIPGAFLAQDDSDGHNPGSNYIRVALVDDAARIREALERIVTVLA